MTAELFTILGSAGTIAVVGALPETVDVGNAIGDSGKFGIMGICIAALCWAVWKLYGDMKDQHAKRDAGMTAALNNFAVASERAREADHALTAVIGKMVDVIQTCQEHSRAKAPQPSELPPKG